MRLAGAVLCAFLALVPTVQAVDAPALKPGEKPQPGSTEAELWYGMDQAEKQIRDSPLRVTDPALNGYVQEVLCEVTADYCKDLRLYIIDVPVFNASMAPNGVVLVFSGALLRMQDEAELALVLGHEFAHYRQRHSLQSWDKAKDTTAFLATFGVLTWVGGAGLAGGIAQMAGLANMMQFSRDKEREADDIGFEIVSELGYDPQAGVRIWQRMQNEEKANVRAKHSPVFASHPKTSERLEDMAAAAAGYKGTFKTNQQAFDVATEPYLQNWLEAELSRRMYDTSIQVIRDLRAGARPELEGIYDFYQGEALRRRKKPGDLEQADILYTRAVSNANAPAEVWREYGFAMERSRKRDEALFALKSYLAKKPEAGDRLFIEQDIVRLETKP
ncbi:M48 family metalloprotease [Arenimonas sp.]|jgi:predicted Zn-dependent protease|uniref:M48 family metalloprotease n=1 Tax=Arenimonas sp. TaxID=1872635 RepID=UPI0037BEDB43